MGAATGALGGLAGPKSSLLASLVAVLKSAAVAKAAVAVVAAGSVGFVVYGAATGDVPFVHDAVPEATASSTDRGGDPASDGGSFDDPTDDRPGWNATGTKAPGGKPSSGDPPLLDGDTGRDPEAGGSGGGQSEPGPGDEEDALGWFDELLPTPDPGDPVPEPPTLPLT